MKKLIFLCLLTLTIASCELSGDGHATHYVLGPVQEVEMPATYRVDSISEIIIRYNRPDNCHVFNGFYYVADNYTRTVAIEYARMDRNDCISDPEEVFEVPLRFKPRQPGTYLFRFWDGVNDDGTNHFFETEVNVPL